MTGLESYTKCIVANFVIFLNRGTVLCGLVGYTGKFRPENWQMLEQLLYLDQIRGDDSTGIAVCEEDNTTIFKKVDVPQKIFPCAQWTNIKSTHKPVALIGHNRAATKGVVSVANAHPFRHGDITLAHNGTLYDRSLERGKNFGTDSEGICWSVNEIGIEETWKELNGAACLTWWDAADNTMNFIRNEKRPLHMMYLSDDSGVWWASEAWMLRWLETYCGVEQKKIWSPNPHYHFKVSYNEKTEKVSEVTEKLDPFIWNIVKPKKVVSHIVKKTSTLLSHLDSLIPKPVSGSTCSHNNTSLTKTTPTSGTKPVGVYVGKKAKEPTECLGCAATINKDDSYVPFGHDLSLCFQCKDEAQKEGLSQLSRVFYLKEIHDDPCGM